MMRLSKCECPLFNGTNLYFEPRLSVSILLEISALLLVFDDVNCLVPTDFFKSGFYRTGCDKRSAYQRGCTAFYKENFIKGDCITNLSYFTFWPLNLLNFKDIAFGDLVLFPSCLDDCKFHNGPIIHIFQQKHKLYLKYS